jgi:hypothetical protein
MTIDLTDEELLLHQLKNPPTMSMALNKDHLYRMMADHMKGAALRLEALTAKVKLMDDLDVINGEKIEALTEQLKTVLDREAATTARYDAKTDELEAKLAECEARLGKAVEGLREIAGFAEKEWVTPSGEAPPDVQNLCDIARAIIAEIEGEKT